MAAGLCALASHVPEWDHSQGFCGKPRTNAFEATGRVSAASGAFIDVIFLRVLILYLSELAIVICDLPDCALGVLVFPMLPTTYMSASC